MHCKRRGSEKSTFLAIFWGFWFSEERLFCKNSTRKPSNLIKSPIFTNTRKYDLYDFFRGAFGPFIQEKEQEAGPKTPLKKSDGSYFRRAQIRWVIWRSSKFFVFGLFPGIFKGKEDLRGSRVLWEGGGGLWERFLAKVFMFMSFSGAWALWALPPWFRVHSMPDNTRKFE